VIEIGVTLGIPDTIYVITGTWLGQKRVWATTNKMEAELYFEQLEQSDQLRPEWHEYDLRKQGGK
jgi:hypothetical protein